MNLHFTLLYRSNFGENFFIRFFDAKNINSPVELPLLYKDQASWDLSIHRNELPFPGDMHYQMVKRQGNIEKAIFPRRLVRLKDIKTETVLIMDEVQKGLTFEDIKVSKPFRLISDDRRKKKKVKDPDVIIQLWLPELHPAYIPCITGSSKKLHKWNDRKPVHMEKIGGQWLLKLNLNENDPVEFKICIYDLKSKKIIAYEQGDNRAIPVRIENETNILNISPEISVDLWKGTGVNFPLSALKTENTWGCGDFTSLRTAGKWCSKTGIKMIQLLPLNDTISTFTNADSYPYAPISAYAIHPVYIDVNILAKNFGFEIDEETLSRISFLNQSDNLLLTEVVQLKFSVLRKIYEQEMQMFRDDFAWFSFFDLHREWLQPYAAFCYLRDMNGTAEYSNWQEHGIYDESEIEELVSPGSIAYEDIGFYYFVQFHLHLQLTDTITWLNKQGIIVKGDLPIGINRNSVETWMDPGYFKLEMQAGAPPDAFSQSGQNWSFPTYNWQAMENDNYSWWRKRLEHLQLYFDAIRIDHVLGLFRIWSIPIKYSDGRMGVFDPVTAITENDLRRFGVTESTDRLVNPFTADENDIILIRDKNGFHFRINMHQTESYKALAGHEQYCLQNAYNDYFFQRQNALWKEEGVKKLSMIKGFTSMMICAEDLGMVPSFVENVLSEKEILNLRVERMPLNNDLFFSPSKADYLSVVTPTTHDMSTLPEWWQDAESPVQWYYNYQLQSDGPAPELINEQVAKKIIENHLASPAMWSVFLFQDLFAMDDKLKNADHTSDRINDPSNPHHVWDYRMHIYLEDLLSSKDFNRSLKKMIRINGR